MNTDLNRGLVGVRADLVSGLPRLKQFCETISHRLTIQNLSNVYKKQKTESSSDFNSELWIVIRFATGMNQYEIKNCIDQASDPEESKSVCQGFLLCLNDLVWIEPDLPLPHPQLISQPVILRCATEVWPEYEHPVLKSSLNEVIKTVPVPRGLEFFAQGGNLI